MTFRDRKRVDKAIGWQSNIHVLCFLHDIIIALFVAFVVYCLIIADEGAIVAVMC